MRRFFVQQRTNILAVLFSLAFTAGLYAQPAPVKWGEVPIEDLQMQTYPADSNAAVVILADYGHVYFMDDLTLVFKRHTRIKILSEAGYDWGTVTVPYLGEKRAQRLRDIKGQTFTLSPDGEVVRHKMNKGDLFTEDLDGSWKQARFTLPALEPGAVIEYAYRIDSENPVYLRGWTFQKSEPTRWSEYRAEIPNFLNYVSSSVGMLNYAVQDTKPITMAHGGGVRFRWAMEAIPALRKEPFMTTPKDYRSAIQFQLQSFSHPSIGTITHMSSWTDLAEELMEMSSFGKQLKPSKPVRQRVDEITAGRSDPAEKMAAVYDFVRTTISWNEQYNWIPSQKVREVLKTRTGNSADVSLTLIAMLRAAGIEAHPVLVSTRSHGLVLQVYPLLSQFNDVLVAAEIDGETYLLDATDPLRPHTLLPVEALNGKGLLVRGKHPEWIDIKANGRYIRQTFFQATLDASGTLSGTLQTSDDDYSALRKRHQLKEADTPEAFVESVMFANYDDPGIETCSVTDEALTEPLKTQTVFSLPGYAQVAGPFIYVNPTPFGRIDENPLRLPERTFPVDMAYPRTTINTFQMQLPEGYAVQETPKNIRMQVPTGDALFQRLVEVQNGTLMMQTQFTIKRTIYEPEHYAALRSFYEQIVAAGAEQVVLKQVTAADGENR